jgi:LysM repeat protein
MIKPYFPLILCLCGLSAFTLSASAQSDHLRVTVANLSQDVSLLTQHLKTIRLEMEELHRENARLRAQIAAASSNRDTEAQITHLSDAIGALRREYRAADETSKQQIIAEVSRQINALAKETQGAINAVAQAVDSQPQIGTGTPVHFSDDYPKSGKPYVVRSGDTLSGIARKHGSTIKHIQNANKILNPSRDLKVGETIFIPIAQ